MAVIDANRIPPIAYAKPPSLPIYASLLLLRLSVYTRSYRCAVAASATFHLFAPLNLHLHRQPPVQSASMRQLPSIRPSMLPIDIIHFHSVYFMPFTRLRRRTPARTATATSPHLPICRLALSLARPPRLDSSRLSDHRHAFIISHGAPYIDFAGAFRLEKFLARYSTIYHYMAPASCVPLLLYSHWAIHGFTSAFI